MQPDDDNVLVRKWIYLGGAICYKCNWVCIIDPAPTECPICHNHTNSRFKGIWEKMPRKGFGLQCPKCKDSGKRGSAGRKLLRGRAWYKDVKKGEKLFCKICGAKFTKKVIRT